MTKPTKDTVDEFLFYCLERSVYMQGQKVAGDWREQTIKPMRAKFKALLRTELTSLLAEMPEKKNPSPELRRAEGEKAQEYVRALSYFDGAISIMETVIKKRIGELE